MKNTSVLTSIIGILIWIVLLVAVFPTSRNYFIHRYNSAVHPLWDLECTLTATPFPSNQLAQLYPDDYQDIFWFIYTIHVTNISSGYIKIEPIPELSVSSNISSIHFLPTPHDRLREINFYPTETFPPDPVAVYEQQKREGTLAAWKLKKWEKHTFQQLRFFSKTPEIQGQEKHVVNFYVDYSKNSWPRQSKYCYVK